MKELNFAIYRRMCLIRRSKDAIRRIYMRDNMKMHIHMSTGEKTKALTVLAVVLMHIDNLGIFSGKT